jgi:hypothetical protein
MRTITTYRKSGRLFILRAIQIFRSLQLRQGNVLKRQPLLPCPAVFNV